MLHEGGGHPLDRGAVARGHHLAEHARRDLPGDAEAVLEPAAGLGLGHRRERRPEAVDLGLVLAVDQQRHRLVEGGVGLGAVHRHERLAVDAELGVHDRAGGVLAAAVVAHGSRRRVAPGKTEV